MIALAAVVVGLLSSPSIADELSRLEGHEIRVASDGASYTIVDIAGEGAPIVGIVGREGAALVLEVTSDKRFELRGPLATPRIAGPGYKVWVVGRVSGQAITVRRLGVLRSPHR